MKKIVILIVALGLVAGYFYASPYLTLRKIKVALDTADEETLKDYIDFPVLRQSLKEQFNAMLVKEAATDLKDNPFGVLGVAFISKFIDGMMDGIFTPAGLANLLGRGESGQTDTAREGSDRKELFKDAHAGFDSISKFSVYIEKTRVVLTRTGFSWKVTNVILPPDKASIPKNPLLAASEKKSQDSARRQRALQEEDAQRQRATAEVAEITMLKARKKIAQEAVLELAKFKVEKSRFYKRKNDFGRPDPIIELMVLNGTNHPISRVYFIGTLISPGRSIPWLTEPFNYQIPGGLEPREKGNWKLAPNMFSEWGKVSAPSDAYLELEVIRLDGPAGEKLFSKQEFTSMDQQKLDGLLLKYPDAAS